MMDVFIVFWWYFEFVICLNSEWFLKLNKIWQHKAKQIFYLYTFLINSKHITIYKKQI